MPIALVTGKTPTPSVRTMMMSACLPGASVPIEFSNPAARAPWTVAAFKHRLDRDRRRRIRLAAEAALAHDRALQPEQGVHLSEHVAAERGVEIDADGRRQAVVDRLLVGEALVVEAEQRVRARIDGDVDAGIREQLPRLLRNARAVVEDVVRAEHARLGELRPELEPIAVKFGQDTHVEATCDLPPIEIELTEQADPHQSAISVPFAGEAFDVLRQMRDRRLIIQRRADHVKRADARLIECVERRIGMLRAERTVASVDDGRDAGVERSAPSGGCSNACRAGGISDPSCGR